MKRLFVLLCVASFAVAVPLSSDLLAAKKEKVLICHKLGFLSDGLTEEEGGNCFRRVGGPPVTEGTYCGKTMYIPADAVGGHCGHGDRGALNGNDLGFCQIERDDPAGLCRPSTLR